VTTEPAARRRLLGEARAAAAVSHANIAVVYDVGESNDGVFIAMERVHGRTLRSLLRDGRLAPDRALSILRQIAAGVGAAHRAGVVHRDLKPENVMVTDAGEVKILDFGLAVVQEPPPGEPNQAPDVERSIAEGRLVGTPAYMSPEQAQGGSVTAASDVFALGVLAYEMLTGERPFVGDTVTRVLDAVREHTPMPMRGVPRWFERVVLSCLSKDPSARPQDGDALHRALDKATPRRRSLASSLAAGAALAIASAGIAWVSTRTPTVVAVPSSAAAGIPATTVAPSEPSPVRSAAPAPAPSPQPSARPRALPGPKPRTSTAQSAPRAIDPLSRQK
jgi:serine/threonine protein kinase